MACFYVSQKVYKSSEKEQVQENLTTNFLWCKNKLTMLVCSDLNAELSMKKEEYRSQFRDRKQ